LKDFEDFQSRMMMEPSVHVDEKEEEVLPEKEPVSVFVRRLLALLFVCS
jgi:hypothetical protein